MSLPIDHLGLAKEDAEALRNSGIETNDDFWEATAVNASFLDSIFVEEEVRKRILLRMAYQGVSEAIEISSPGIGRAIPDLLVIASLCLILYGLFHRRDAPMPSPLQQVVVRAKNGLQPFHIISPDDVALQMSAPHNDSFTRLDEVVGHYAGQPLSKGEVLSRGKLSTGPTLLAQLKDRKILQIRLQPSVLLSGTNLPLRISLIVSPRITSAEKGRLFSDVILLSATTQSDGTILAVVSIQQRDESNLASLLGTSEFTATTPAP